MDFTIKTYKQLLKSLQNAGFSFMTFGEYIENKEKGKRKRESGIRNVYPVKSRSEYFTGAKFVILRHDVDALPENSLRFARIQTELGIKGTYYFRAVPQSWDEDIIKNIHELGHEIGYHYENMDVAFKKSKVKSQKSKVEKSTPEYVKLIDLAYDDFCENLENLQKIVPVSTICMHGSPKSKFDNKAIWDKYDYKVLELIGEPYFDVDFNEVFYLTDTGRRWDGWKVSVRDKIPQQEEWAKQGLIFYSTQDIIKAANQGQLPDKIMMTFHPQRWHSRPMPWVKEIVLQNAKNQAKRVLIAMRE